MNSIQAIRADCAVTLASGINQIMVFDTAYVQAVIPAGAYGDIELYVRIAADNQLRLDLVCDQLQAEELQVYIHHEERTVGMVRLSLRQSSIVQLGVNIVLEQDAQVELQSRYQLADNHAITASVRVEHIASNSRSNIQFKGVLADNARWHMDGMLHIAHNAMRSEGALYDQTLLFDQARAVSVPSLEALNNDIACRHGSAIGMIDEDSLRYLMMRGMEHADSRNLMIDCFLA